MGELMNIRSLKDYQREGLGKQIKKQISSNWIFETFFDKFILLVLGILGLWKGLGLIGGLF